MFKKLGKEVREEISCEFNNTNLSTQPSTLGINQASASNHKKLLIKCFRCLGFEHIALNCPKKMTHILSRRK